LLQAKFIHNALTLIFPYLIGTQLITTTVGKQSGDKSLPSEVPVAQAEGIGGADRH
jgi:hypothetical protein